LVNKKLKLESSSIEIVNPNLEIAQLAITFFNDMGKIEGRIWQLIGEIKGGGKKKSIPMPFSYSLSFVFWLFSSL
jgi:hypothetical protein